MPTYSTQLTFSFADKVAYPTQVAVFDIDGTTGTSTTLYQTTDYTVNWVDKSVTLTTPLILGNRLRIDAYEVGNGDQLVKSNSETNPIRTDTVTGLCEIYLDCNYTGTFYNGSGVIVSGTAPENAVVTSTDSIDDSMQCDSVAGILLNNPITFTGVVFGNILEDTVYYIKTISISTNRITISPSRSSGIAGPVLELATDTGIMSITIQTGTADVYSPPAVVSAGTILTMGELFNITSIRGSTNSITCNTTTGLLVGATIVFGNTIFGGIIQPLMTYYIESIVDSNEFTISETMGGPILALTTSSGGCVAITNDYAFAVIEQTSQAKIVFAAMYDHMTDFISYTVFGETVPSQYGYTLPCTEFFNVAASIVSVTETEAITNLITVSDTSMLVVDTTVIFAGTTFGNIMAGTTYYVMTIDSLTTITISETIDGIVFALTSDTGLCTMANTTYPIDNYIGGDNATNAVLEKNGLRLTSTEYHINITTNQLILTNAPEDTDVIALTSYNLTDRQYLNTQYGITGNTVSNIVYVNNEITAPLAITNVTATTAPSTITCDSTFNFVEGQTIIFQIGAAGFGGIAVDGTVYFIDSVIDSSTFTISDTPGGPTKIDITTGLGLMVSTIGGTPAVRIQTGVDHGFAENDIVRIDGVLGSTQLNNNIFYAKIISSTEFDLYTAWYDPAYTATNLPVVDVFTYISGGFTWINGIYSLIDTVATATTSVDNLITCESTATLVIDTPVLFSAVGFVIGETLLGGIIAGTTYYIRALNDADPLYKFTISASYQGPEMLLSDGMGFDMSVTQWEQINVDRLWVTVDGARVPSSSLRINPNNNLSILVVVSPAAEVIITNMIPSATPNELTYVQNVNKTNIGSVYRANQQTRTWLTSPLYSTDSVIYVMDVTKITDAVVQELVAPAAVDGIISVILTADKRIISQVIVFNVTTGLFVDANNLAVVIENIEPVLNITGDVLPGQLIVVTTIEGNLLYVNGEQIRFTSVNVSTNSISGLQRGANGTGQQTMIPEYTEVYGVLSQNKLPEALYAKTFSESDFPDNDGDVDGGPLQIFDTPASIFLQRDIR